MKTQTVVRTVAHCYKTPTVLIIPLITHILNFILFKKKREFFFLLKNICVSKKINLKY